MDELLIPLETNKVIFSIKDTYCTDKLIITIKDPNECNINKEIKATVNILFENSDDIEEDNIVLKEDNIEKEESFKSIPEESSPLYEQKIKSSCKCQCNIM